MSTAKEEPYSWRNFLGRNVLLVCRSGHEFRGGVFNAQPGVLRLDVSQIDGKKVKEFSIAVPLSNVAYVQEEE